MVSSDPISISLHQFKLLLVYLDFRMSSTRLDVRQVLLQKFLFVNRNHFENMKQLPDPGDKEGSAIYCIATSALFFYHILTAESVALMYTFSFGKEKCASAQRI